jgi:hypothetical protein
MAKQYQRSTSGLYLPGNESVAVPKPHIPKPWWAGKFTPNLGRAVGQIRFVGTPPKVLFVNGQVCFNPECCCGHGDDWCPSTCLSHTHPQTITIELGGFGDNIFLYCLSDHILCNYFNNTYDLQARTEIDDRIYFCYLPLDAHGCYWGYDEYLCTARFPPPEKKFTLSLRAVLYSSASNNEVRFRLYFIRHWLEYAVNYVNVIRFEKQIANDDAPVDCWTDLIGDVPVVDECINTFPSIPCFSSSLTANIISVGA